MAVQPNTFLDINSNYDYNKKELVSNMNAINNSIFNILSTPYGSRSFRPTYGSKLQRFVHEPMDDITAMQIKSFLMDALGKWEPRIEVDFHSTSVTPIDSGGFKVVVVYVVPSLSVSSSTSMSFLG